MPAREQLDEANYIIVGRTLALPCDDDAEIELICLRRLPPPCHKLLPIATRADMQSIDEYMHIIWYINYKSTDASTQYEI